MIRFDPDQHFLILRRVACGYIRDAVPGLADAPEPIARSFIIAALSDEVPLIVECSGTSPVVHYGVMLDGVAMTLVVKLTPKLSPAGNMTCAYLVRAQAGIEAA